MTRVISGAVLFALAIVAVWLAPPLVFFAVAELVLAVALFEYTRLARHGGRPVPVVLASASAMLTAAAFARRALGGFPWAPLDVVLMSAVVALGAWTIALWRGVSVGGNDALALAATSLFPSLYLGLPVGAMIAIRETRGREALLLLMLTVFVSDTAQYYTGRAIGRRRLAPGISPHKTVEGAAGGFVFGAVVLAGVGAWWLPAVPVALRAALGAMVVAVGIAGDLFESMLKRSVGLKDSSELIPGHGGILDRLDALLFAAPVYYVVLKYV
jgi:phosphatidate cytidylyltransferase